MYVQCERCKTEYDFDDALVSERGTTVKCTNCAHQFRVKRASSGGAQDRWVVTTATGQELIFTSLKELQRAIIAKLVGRGDSLARGNAAPRELGAIAELEPFFENAEPGKASPAVQEARTTQPRKPHSSRPPPVPGANIPALTPPVKRLRSEPPPVRPRVDTLRPYGDLAAAPPADPNATLTEHPVPKAANVVGAPPPDLDDSGETEADPSTARKPNNLIPIAAIPPQLPPQRAAAADLGRTAAMTQAAVVPPPAPVREAPARASNPPPLPQRASAPPHPPPPTRRAPSQPAIARPQQREVERTSPLPPPTRPVRRVMASVDDEVDSLPISTTPRRVGGWVVLAVIVGGVGIFGAYMGRSYLEKGVHASSAAAPLDPRAQQFLTAGEAALLQGDLDSAKTNFDKASGVAEKDPRVLLPEARLATIRADVPWLKQRLLAPPGATLSASAQADVAANKAQLDDLAAKAKKAADDAVAASPDDPAALRVKVDALRIAGDRDAARALVGRVATNASQPDTAYVLGALDLAELDPPWSVVLERLRTAAAGEAGLGRARAALSYALARSGDVPQARQEADRLASLAHPPPLVSQLRAFIDGAQAGASTDGGVAPAAGSAPLSVDVSKLPTSTNPAANAGGGGGGNGLSSDPRTLLAQADTARQKKDFPRARLLYEAALAKNPNDSEALSGLGDVSHDEKDLQSAEAFYKRAIGVNPTFLPALIGLADATWDLGDRPGAQKQYKEITDRFPEGSYPQRVKQRSADAPPPADTQAPSAAPTATEAPATANP
jgi:predicted Zn finger-like uncharacterized protein